MSKYVSSDELRRQAVEAAQQVYTREMLRQAASTVRRSADFEVDSFTGDKNFVESPPIGEKMQPVKSKDAGRQLTKSEYAGFTFIFSLCLLAASWALIALMWHVATVTNAPLLVEVIFTWIFWTWFISSLCIVLPLLCLWAYKHDAFN